MKKKLIVALVTSILMIALMGGFLWKMKAIQKKIAHSQEVLEDEERDVSLDKKAWKDLKPGDAQELFLSGKRKNVVTVEEKGLDQIYSVKQSTEVEKMLTNLKKKGAYESDSPLWAYNPYGTNPLSLYLYFKSDGKCYCRYTISVEDEDIPDFTRTLENGATGNTTEEHEYQILGLVPGRTNYLILKLYNSKDELSKTLRYQIKMPETYSGAKVKLSFEKGRSKEKISNGLFTVFQTEKSKKKQAVLLYDNSGVLRAEFPVEASSCGQNAEVIYDNLVYACSGDEFALVNALGQVVRTIKMPGYQQYGAYAYDGFGAMYVLAEPKNGDHGKDIVVRLQMDNGECSVALRGQDVLGALYQKKASKSRKNWLGLDSIQVLDGNRLVLGSSQLSSVFKVSNVNSLLPKLDYIIADKKLWEWNNKYQKKLLKKALAEGETEPPEETPVVESIFKKKKVKKELFASQYGQRYVRYNKPKGLADGQYYLEMLNENAGYGAASGANTSYYYEYLVDENAKTYSLSTKKKVEICVGDGNYQEIESGAIMWSAAKKQYEESGKDGKTIRRFNLKGKIHQVEKKDWKGFWFY